MSAKKTKHFTMMSDRELRKWAADLKDEITSRQSAVRIIERELRNRLQLKRKPREVAHPAQSKAIH